jgi:hypothetical protein
MGRTVVLMLLLTAVAGGPAIVYVARELLPELATGTGSISPLVLVWRAAAPRQGGLLPEPLWAALLWPAAGAAAGLGQMLIPERSEAAEASG